MPHESPVTECIPDVVDIHEPALFIDNLHNVKSILHLHMVAETTHVQSCRTGKTVTTCLVHRVRRAANCIFMPCLNFNKA